MVDSVKSSLEDKGILYVATGKKFVDEAVESAKSLKRHMPNIPVVLYTDDPSISNDVFTSTIVLKDPIYTQGDKIVPMANPPFDKTIFLDTDTYVSDSFEDVFDILDRFDLAITHESSRLKNFVPECPESFVEMNSGVIGFVRNEKTMELMGRWYTRYLEQLSSTGNKSDQGVLRKALYESDLSIYILPPEYNFRTKFPGFLGRGLKAKILHGRGVDMPFFATSVNKLDAKRVVVPGLIMPSTCGVIIPTKVFSRISIVLSQLSSSLYRFEKKKSIRLSRRILRLKSMLKL